MALRIIGTCGACDSPVREGNGYAVANKGRKSATYFHNSYRECQSAMRAEEVADFHSSVLHAGRDRVIAYQLAQFD